MGWLRSLKNYRDWKKIRTNRRADYLLEQKRKPHPDPVRLKELKRLYQIAIDKTAEAYRASRPRAWADRHDAAALSQLLLDHHNTRCDNYRSDSTGDTAGDCLRTWATGQRYRVRAGNSGHPRVLPSVTLLRGLVHLADHARRSIGLNAMASATHRNGSGHYDDPTRCCDVAEELDGYERGLLAAKGVKDFDENEVHDHVYVGPNP